MTEEFSKEMSDGRLSGIARAIGSADEVSLEHFGLKCIIMRFTREIRD